ncbi:MAG: hypothetical protein GQ550_02515 [Gammaproteobacteria bacterium]|nr:hypothetical protein [Gammaproteobacteria bacterium]
MVNKYYFKVLLSVLLGSLAACGNEVDEKLSRAKVVSDSELETVALPDISHQPVRLNVANVVNPRFKQLSDMQIKKILLRSQQMVKQYFNIEIKFSDVETLSIKDVFNHLDSQVIANRKGEIVNIDLIDKQAREAMQQALFKTLANYLGNKQNIIDYAQPYLLQPDIKQKDFIDLSYALVDTLVSRLEYWKTQKASDGEPVFDSNGYHEWVWWDSLGYSDLPYDILITNQLVASAEYYAMDVHSSIRGGITAGTTTYNKNTALNAYAYIMVYPMLNDSALLTKLRQDETYTDDQIINYSAALLTHELGHLLLHLGHPFGNKSCIMSPTVMLNYRDWYENLDAEQCAVGSSNEMKPGAASIIYNRNW